jgi:hypothetical protein
LCFGQARTQSAGGSIISSPAAKLARINDFVIAKHKYHDLSGNVLVAEKGRVIYTKSIGFADVKRAQPLTNASVFNQWQTATAEVAISSWPDLSNPIST